MSKGFTAERANAILQANFGPNYAGATIALLTHLTGDHEYPEGKEVSPTTNVDGKEKANGYTRIPLDELELPQDEDGNVLGYIQNAKALHFPEAEQSWGTIVGFRIYSNFRGVNNPGSTDNQGAITGITYYQDTGLAFEGSLIEQKPVPKETIPLFRKGYIRIGLDHTPPAIETT